MSLPTFRAENNVLKKVWAQKALLQEKIFWNLFWKKGAHSSDPPHMGGGDYLKYPKRGWNRKEGRENKVFKKGRG